jgi:hypothetical protein
MSELQKKLDSLLENEPTTVMPDDLSEEQRASAKESFENAHKAWQDNVVKLKDSIAESSKVAEVVLDESED